MGEIADMMLDGTLCEGCGSYIGKDVGYPRRCEDCEPIGEDDGKETDKGKGKKDS